MDFYKYHSEPKKLSGHHEADDIVADRIIIAIRSEKLKVEDLTSKQLDTLSRNAKTAYIFAHSILKKRWPKGEDAIAKNAKYSHKYAYFVLKDRFPKGEEIISKDPETAYWYAEDVIKGPWPKGEDAIAKDGTASYYYAREHLKGKRFKKGEPSILRSQRLEYILGYAENVLQHRWIEAEEIILNSEDYLAPDTAASYAIHVLEKRWPEAEKLISLKGSADRAYKSYFGIR